MRGTEKIHRNVFKTLVIRRILSSSLATVLFTLAAYYKFTEQPDMEVVCVSTCLLLDTFVVLGYNAYFLCTKGEKLLEILSNIVCTSKSQISRRETPQDIELNQVYIKFKVLLPFAKTFVIIDMFQCRHHKK